MTRIDSAQGPVVVVAGARPNFMKVVPILHELDRRAIPRIFVHTGQHYDVQMSAALLSDLGSPEPDILLSVGSGSHAVQTARVMERFEPVVVERKPSWVVVVGDVNSTLACALVVAKLRPTVGCRVAHVEAGLRSGDWDMPEEVNRVLTDRLSDMLLTPSDDAMPNLEREGVDLSRAKFVGNVMIDSLLTALPRAEALAVPSRFGLERGAYLLTTLHRPSNVDNDEALSTLVRALAHVSEGIPVLFPAHPRTAARIESLGLSSSLGRVTMVKPLTYLEMVGVQAAARAIVTDSGGVQEESTVLGVPCLTLRESTERPVTVTHGTNRLSTWPPTLASIAADVSELVTRPVVGVGRRSPKGWDGKAASRIVDALQGA